MNELPFGPRDVILTNTQEEELYEAISSAFNIEELKTLTRFKLGVDLENITGGAGNTTVQLALLNYLVRYNCVAEFTRVAINKNPDNPKLRKFAQEIGLIAGAPPKERLTQMLQQFAHEFDMAPDLTQRQQFERMLEAFARELDLSPPMPQESPQANNLERIIQQSSDFLDMHTLTNRLEEAQRWMCLIEVDGEQHGSGFLAGSRQVLTTCHSVQKLIKSGDWDHLICKFDQKLDNNGDISFSKQLVLAKQEPILDYSPFSKADLSDENLLPGPEELDYAVLNLEEETGKERGWFKLSAAATGNEHETMFLLHHPSGEPLKLSVGELLKFNDNRTRFSHTGASTAGSSGAPCFDRDLNLIGMHHAQDPDWRRSVPVSKAIPIIAIRDLLAARGIDLG